MQTMPYLCFSRESDNRKESFFLEIPRRNSHCDDIPSACTEDEHCSSSDVVSIFSESATSNHAELPDYLKSCIYFCCCCIRYDVERGMLVRLLLAEGLIPEKPREIMEDVAEMVIDELIELGFLQVIYHYGAIGFLEVADPYKRLCIREVEETDFIAIAADAPVRAEVEDDGKNIPPDFKGLEIQSLFLITIERRSSALHSFSGLSQAYMQGICKLRFLLVLHLNGKIEVLPDELGDLIHLRYLGLHCSYLNLLPPTLGNLQNLQTLEVQPSGRNLQQLPAEVPKIQNLRHLVMSKCINDGEIRLPKGIKVLANLQTCDGAYAGGGTAKELSNLTQLRKLGVKRVSEDHATELAAAIMKMDKLVYLSLQAERSLGRTSSLFPELVAFTPPPLLQELRLSGGLVDIPNWIASLENLTTLSLCNSNQLDNPTSVLQFLPKLKHLFLFHAFKGKTIGKEFCEAGGFAKLETLTIVSRLLVEWTEIVSGAFPSLKHLCFRNCLKLRFLPEGLQNISTLEGLSLMPSYNDIGRRLKGEENYKIKHIANVIIHELY